MSAAGKKLESQFICTGSGGPVQHGEPPRMTMTTGNKRQSWKEHNGKRRHTEAMGRICRRVI